jgi:hypothetical protein
MALKWEEKKDPDGVLDYGLDWTEWLGEDSLASSTWVVPDGLTKPTPDSFTEFSTLIWLGGGVAGTTYDIVNRITTAGGRTCDRTIKLKVVNR